MDPSWIALITSIVAPTVTTLICSHYEHKHHEDNIALQRDLQITRTRIQAMQSSYDEFAEAVGKVLSIDTQANVFHEYMSALHKIIRFLPKNLRDRLLSFDDSALYGENRAENRKALADLLSEIAAFMYSVDH